METNKHSTKPQLTTIPAGTINAPSLFYLWKHDHFTGKGEFNPFKMNGISHSYQLDQSISILRVIRWYFLILFKFLKNIL